MQAALEEFQTAYTSSHPAVAVAHFLSPRAPPEDAARLHGFQRLSNEVMVTGDVQYAIETRMRRQMSPDEMRGWTEVISCYWRAVDRIVKAENAQHQGRFSERQALDVHDAWNDLTNNFVKHISNGALPFWTIFTLCLTANHLRLFAIQADEQMAKAKPVAFSAGFSDDIGGTPKNEKLGAAVRVFNKVFSLCLGDRSPDMNQSRKWGVYCVANLLFRTYFKLKTISLSKNLVRSIDAQSDLPQFQLYPLSHRVTYLYYVGLISFVQEDYSRAEVFLTQAWNLCYVHSTKNKELIMTYLIPCRLITHSTVPTSQLLNQFPDLNRLFGDLFRFIRKGDLSGFDRALAEGEPEFVKKRIFLTLERSRDIVLRNLFRNVFLAAGYEDLTEGQTEKDRIRKTRIPLAHFAAALRMSTAGAGGSQVIDDDEVECLLANTIYKNHMKGYISREHQMVVLGKKGAFPGTGV
ncbi:hypothetical protein P280DRAFT_472113 [Massarina eburnea CBS 473.64]|uniref:Protein CSN12 homolog n=1 Tax=Massarina eburnea CBS 473.64 TaxID=1395130 RepID=A0A6A6RT20_9PLEO|nr:hypothetical protein P280DRAFT_472113 [Massarina eburnea CBS 473.64]